ncbi:glycoside hydrolase family 85 protein [Amanita thiersii Skay4041]|uniref:Glycoside hydrolase family 85 protein n=1 Tax=Amanita thiersii Skay4041 TaxID=703135 RepID=A0A2A9NRV8_9AGAR|nr:glycoside hydrolase family 85 protein [Amanita thiersii Skay4041]
MPISGNTPVPPSSDSQFFDSLSELDAWAANSNIKDTQPEALPYVPRNPPADPNERGKGKVLVCHDFKGGYVENPFSISYTFNFWSVIDTFVYFSHKQVSIPPAGWINAAHRQGVKMLGVLLFEHDGVKPDLLRLLAGPSMTSRDASKEQFITGSSFTFSIHYAQLLADLACQRGFDGYLMNFELAIGGELHARGVADWVSVLRSELWKKVGPHAEVIWYDSLTIKGNVRYQNRLNDLNRPFFLSSTGFFSNYRVSTWIYRAYHHETQQNKWRESYPMETIQYFFSLDSANMSTLIPSNAATAIPQPAQHVFTHQDIFMGIDIWGRGTFGGGGFSTHRALEAISPNELGLSVALFAPGWTWESREGNAGRTWERWWDEEVSFWAGKVPGLNLPSLSMLHQLVVGQLTSQTTYKSISELVSKKMPPDPKHIAFLTTFSPGIGRGWWVEGEKVWRVDTVSHSSWTHGWQDVEKQCSIGDLLWPIPKLTWNEETQDHNILPSSSASVNMDDAWNGGSCLNLTLSESEAPETKTKLTIWIPVQSLSLTSGQEYSITAVYKIAKVADGLHIVVEHGLKPLSPTHSFPIEVVSREQPKVLQHGWTGLGAHIRVAPTNDSESQECALGLVVKISGAAGPKELLVDLMLGQMGVHVEPGSKASSNLETINVVFEPTSPLRAGETLPIITTLENFNGTLSWVMDYPLHSTQPSYAYCNIYAQFVSPPSTSTPGKEKPENAIWLGTSGVESGGKDRFVIVGKNLQLVMKPTLSTEGELPGKVRLYVQGVDERTGKVMEWEKVGWVDVQLAGYGKVIAS